MEAFPGQQHYLKSVPIALTVVATVLVIARTVTVWRHRGWLGMEEAMVVCSNITLVIFCVILNETARYGFGLHTKDIPSHGGQVHVALEYYYLSQIAYKTNITFNKLAFLLLYLRVFSIPSFRKICQVTLLVIGLASTAFIIATVFQCTPIRKAWHKTDPKVHGHCVNNTWFRWTWASYNLFTDVWVFLLPIPVISKLQMSLSKKLGLIILFTLGLFVCLTTGIRMKALVQSTHATDVPWDSCPTNLWSFIETAVGLICACLISLRKAVAICFPRLLSTKDSKSGKYVYDYSGSRRVPGTGSQKLSEYGLDNLDSSRNENGKVLGQSITTVGLGKGGGTLRRTESEDYILQGIQGITVQRDVSIKSEEAAGEEGKSSTNSAKNQHS
ncbi:hypothetical protein K432DRAFT_102835 [Lepidopterella palustris CBS 459.81]|uniref:Rhodopsin domain-containing protein n=1 Tax=Lepidopterella palustris CBS 459.81 TaxID=1314670 RepID=A0A8E2E637_9PEZI|nr:hypothetical protein K432DRAFT_102835 [Lepidopterella palustris CBS 459.81]